MTRNNQQGAIMEYGILYLVAAAFSFYTLLTNNVR